MKRTLLGDLHIALAESLQVAHHVQDMLVVRNDDTRMAHFQLLVALCLKVKALYGLEELDKPTDDIHVLHHLSVLLQ